MAPPGCAVIDVDEPESWPAPLLELVEGWREAMPDCEYVEDLMFPAETEAQLLLQLEGHRLRAYHCTRLLPHESEQIRIDGLRPFTTRLSRSS
jgi:hypothetical protein